MRGVAYVLKKDGKDIGPIKVIKIFKNVYLHRKYVTPPYQAYFGTLIFFQTFSTPLKSKKLFI